MHPKIRFFLLFFIITFSVVSQKKTNSNINVYLQKADTCRVKFEYANSFKYISKAITIAQKNKDINAEVLCNIKLIELYRHATLFKKSDYYLKKTTALINNNKSKISNKNLMYYFNRKAALFSEFYHNPDSVLHYSKKVLTIAQSQFDENIEFTSLMEIGYAYEQKNNFQQAINYYEKALELAKKSNKKDQCSNALVNIARVFDKKNEYKKSLEKCDEGLTLQKNGNDFFQKLLFYNIKQKVYEKMGNKAAAFDNLKLRLKYTDLYYEKKINDKLLEEEKRYELLEKDKKITEQKINIDLIRKQRFLLASIIMLFVFASIALSYYSGRLRSVNKKLDDYSKQNAFLLKEANHRINNNLQLIIILLNEELDKIENINSDAVAIKKVLAKIESISILHRYLYLSKEKNTVRIDEYLTAIVYNFSDIFTDKKIKLNLEIEKHNLLIDLAMYLGLLTTELFINSVKYAYTEQQEKKINLHVYKSENKLHYIYNDNGQQAKGSTIKPKLIIKICKQIKADFVIETKNGFEISISKEIPPKNEV